jgi:tetratricopeptide (TPR) repeat protein
LLPRLILSVALMAVLNGRLANPGVLNSRRGLSGFTPSQQKFLRPLLAAPPGGLSDAQLEQATSELERAEATGQQHLAAALHYVLCQTYFTREQLDLALAAAIRGRDAARQSNDPLLAALSGFGIARIHMRAGSFAAGERAGLEALQDAARARYRSTEIRSVLAAIQSYLQKREESERQFRLALQEASALRDRRAQAGIEELYGLNLLRWNRIEEGHAAILNSFRIREKDFPRELAFSYRSLARSELARKRFAESIQWADKALATPAPGLARNWIHYHKALALKHMDRKREALDEVRRGIEVTRRLRLFFPIGDAIQIGMERDVQSIYSLYADLASSLALRDQTPSTIREAFQAAQENRAWSLRVRVASGMEWRRKLPPQYWTKLHQLRARELLPDSGELARLQAELAEMETVAGLKTSLPIEETVADFRKLAAGELLVAFHFGEQAIRWDATNSSLRMARLEHAGQVQALAEKFQAFPEDAPLGRALCDLLFQGLPEPPAIHSLTIVPDQILFRVPFAALRTARDGADRYLAQIFRLRLVPAANFVRRDASPSAGGVLAIGDPVSNRADPRWRGNGSTSAAAPVFELPRLAGSRREIERCLRVWPEPRILLTGRDITLERFQQHLLEKPRLLHFATHVYQPPDPEVSPVLTLGLTASAEPVVLNSASIAALPEVPPVVTLSGCGSGRGALAPGAGLLGLTRAWLMAGATAVVASLWPVIDDSGDFFQAFYQNLQRHGPHLTPETVAEALQKAQVQMIHAGGWRASPRYWAAYFVIGAL